MTLKSMTGFARTEGSDALARWHWEVRAVNGRGLDLRTRLPAGYEALEVPVRKLAASGFQRGNITLNLQVRRSEGGSEIILNEAVLEQMLKATDAVSARTTVTPPSAVQLLGLKGVLEVRELEEDAEAAAKRLGAVMQSLESAIAGVVASRAEEGGRLAIVIEDQISQIERLTGEIERTPARQLEVLRARLTSQVALLLESAGGTGAELDEQRLYQEAALLATRYDIEEELKRLHAHIAAARDLLRADEAVGRRLDFLTQEFNREANTLCSKSNDVDVTKLGLALKAVIDQMREQVQNIE